MRVTVVHRKEFGAPEGNTTKRESVDRLLRSEKRRAVAAGGDDESDRHLKGRSSEVIGRSTYYCPRCRSSQMEKAGEGEPKCRANDGSPRRRTDRKDVRTE